MKSGEWHGDEGEGFGFASRMLPFIEQNNVYKTINFRSAGQSLQ